MARFETPYNKRTNDNQIGRAESAQAGIPARAASGSGARRWNSWWSRRSPNLANNDNPPVRIGIDAGSKTLKLVALDATGAVVFGLYHRHRSDVRTSLADLFHEVIWRYGDFTLPMAVTGSAGIGVADMLGLPFVQEVIATTNAVRTRIPDADCIIELGGEDAKITYLDDPVEQRMNATCAGGTGDFIDGIASMLGIKTREISKLAFGAQRTYPIASRCAVFAQTDVRPLINAGASKADIAQSVLEAVVRQTLGGLACGRPVSGKVVFLGGPLEHIPALVIAFRRKLGLKRADCVKPLDAHLFGAMGAIETAVDAPAVTLSHLEQRMRQHQSADDGTSIAGQRGNNELPPLFADGEERTQFYRRHAAEHIPTRPMADTQGPLFLGFDAGSTSIKYVLIDQDGMLVASDYRLVEGDTFATATAMLRELLTSIQPSPHSTRNRSIAQAIVTGYGEDLLRAGLGFDDGVVETVAHLRAARQFRPDVSFVLDIGGQDMKALWVRDGHVVDAVLNEACSSGCGAFVQSSAKSLSLSHEDFSRAALNAQHPLDLGAKCTVFMTSRVRHAQKVGAPVQDIAAGIAYSVVNNVITRIIGKSHASDLGQCVVVQGGTFKSDAVLRAFEKTAGVHAVRPNLAHLAGAYGCALLARDRHRAQSQPESECTSSARSALLSLDQLRKLSPVHQTCRCTGCGNACLASVVDFGNGTRFISGNRCDRAYRALFDETPPQRCDAPNAVAVEQALIAQFGSVHGSGERANVRVGLMNTLNLYESTPFWHTLLAELGFSVIMPDDDSAEHLRDRAAETIPSESVCHPAKLSHLRYAYLVASGAHSVFMPRFERGNRCPVATRYTDAVADNVGSALICAPLLKGLRPERIASLPDDRALLHRALNELIAQYPTQESPSCPPLDTAEFDAALETALEAQRSFEQAVSRAVEHAFAWAEASPHRRVAVLACRPYHIDPALLHHIDRELSSLGFAVVPLLGLPAQNRGKALWKPAKRLVQAVHDFAERPDVEIVALRSFGCGYDAVSFDEAHDEANALHRPFTELKLDDIADTAHIRIRLRTLAYTAQLDRPHTTAARRTDAPDRSCASPTPDLCSTAKALVERVRAGDKLPDPCQNCLTAALPFELQHVGCAPDSNPGGVWRTRPNRMGGSLVVGLVGNPLLVFDPRLNEGIEQLLVSLDCSVVYPDPQLIDTEDVRYLDQLESFRHQGVERVIYLQSFGCLKGHVQSRGAAHQLARQFPDLPVTVIDYDPESSALNRENRIRLAVAHG